MKQIFKGRMYDTDTAECVADYHDGLVGNDFYHIEESLYRKRTGEYFLRGYGGPNTPYQQCCGPNEYCGGERIIPLTEAEAREWCEDRCDAETYVSVFGAIEE